MYNLGLYDESTNKILNKKHDDFDFDITKQMWIVDGYVVDWNFNTYKIYSETIEMTTKPVNSNTDNKADWKNLYVDYVNSLEEAYDDIWIVDLNLRVLRSLSAKVNKEIAEIREGEERNGAR